MKTKRILTLIFVILSLVVAYRFIKFVQKKLQEKKIVVVEKVIPIHMTEAHLGKIEDTVDIVGELHGVNEVTVYSKVPGKFIKKLVQEGSAVKENDVVALVDRDEPAMDYKEAEIKAPINGILTSYSVDIGQTINPQTPLAMVADTSKIKVVVNVSEKDIPRIKIGDLAEIKIDSFPDKEFDGRVNAIESKIDSATRTMELNIELDNKDGLLKTGMFCQGKIIKRTYQGILLPLEVVLREMDERVIYVTNGKVAVKRKVTTGLIQDGDIEIISGIKVGEQVVIEGQDNLQDGTKVEVRP